MDWKPACPSPGCQPARSRRRPPLRAAAGPQLLALAAAASPGPADPGPYHPDRPVLDRFRWPRRPPRLRDLILATTWPRPSFSRAPGAATRQASPGTPAAARRAWRPDLPPPQRRARMPSADRPSHGPAAGVRRRSAGGRRAGAAGAIGGRRILHADGLIRADHPLILAILTPHRSASSLAACCNPLSFVWVMPFGWRVPQATPSRSCSIRLGSAISSTWFSTAPCATQRRGGLAAADLRPSETAALALPRSRRRRLEAGVGFAGRHLETHPRRRRVMAGRALTYGDDALPGAHLRWPVPFRRLGAEIRRRRRLGCERAGHDLTTGFQHRQLYRPARHLEAMANALVRATTDIGRPPRVVHPAERRTRASTLPTPSR